MRPAWIRIDRLNSERWRMELVFSLQEATILSSGDAVQATRRANREFPLHAWESIPTFLNNTFIVKGTSKTGFA